MSIVGYDQWSPPEEVDGIPMEGPSSDEAFYTRRYLFNIKEDFETCGPTNAFAAVKISPGIYSMIDASAKYTSNNRSDWIKYTTYFSDLEYNPELRF